MGSITAQRGDCQADFSGTVVSGGGVHFVTKEENEAIKVLQKELGVKEDGLFGQRTTAALALRAAQSHHNEKDKTIDLRKLRESGFSEPALKALEKLQQNVLPHVYSADLVHVDCPECRAAAKQQATIDERKMPPVPSALPQQPDIPANAIGNAGEDQLNALSNRPLEELRNRTGAPSPPPEPAGSAAGQTFPLHDRIMGSTPVDLADHGIKSNINLGKTFDDVCEGVKQFFGVGREAYSSPVASANSPAVSQIAQTAPRDPALPMMP